MSKQRRRYLALVALDALVIYLTLRDRTLRDREWIGG